MDNLEEKDKSFKKFSLPRLNQEEIEIMYRPITITEIETVIKKKKKKKKNHMHPNVQCCTIYGSHGSNLDVQPHMKGIGRHSTYIQWNITEP